MITITNKNDNNYQLPVIIITNKNDNNSKCWIDSDLIRATARNTIAINQLKVLIMHFNFHWSHSAKLSL